MSRPSSIDKLPVEIRAMIGELRSKRGFTIDEILAHLADMQTHVSRSALGRHVKGYEKAGEKLRNSRVLADALVHELGDAPESKAARLNIELLHSAILDLFMGEDGEIDVRGQAALKGNPEGVMMLAKAMDHLSRSSKTNADFAVAIEARAEKRAKAQAAEAVEEVGKESGLSGATVELIKARIFGVKAG